MLHYKALDEKDLLKLNNVFKTSSKRFVEAPPLMSELITFLCLKLYSLNFAIAHAQKRVIRLIRIRHTCVALIGKKTVLLLETSSGINFEFIKCVKNVKCLTLKKNK